MGERMTSMAGITAVFSYGASRGLDVSELCNVIGLEAGQFSDPLQMVPFALTRRVWCTVIGRLPGDNVGVGVGTAVRNEHLGYVGLLLGQVRNGLELIQLMIDAAPISDTALVDDPVTLRHEHDQVEIRVPPILSAGIPERTEASFLSLVSNLRRLGLPNLRPSAVRAAHARDKKRAIAEHHYGCRVTWNAGEDVICFARESLVASLPGAHPRAADQLRALIAERVQGREVLTFPERVRRVVQQQVLRGSAHQHEVAASLGMSVRSLQRKLRKHGLGYNELATEALQRRAHELLRNGAFSLEEVARKLGYSEVGTFARFWKRQTGHTPARYRALLGS